MTEHSCPSDGGKVPYYGRNDPFIATAIKTQPSWLRQTVGHLVIQPDGCWTWPRSVSADGYGRVCIPAAVKRTAVLTHRLVWMALRGPIPSGLVLDHDGPNGCHNRACANPDHLQPTTNRHNSVVTASGGAAAEYLRRTRCARGHLLKPDTEGSRKCRDCARGRYRARNDLVRAAASVLGISQTAYRRNYGTARATAEAILGRAS